LAQVRRQARSRARHIAAVAIVWAILLHVAPRTKVEQNAVLAAKM
jgi:hypothetical protein